jgi:hypothetical protein
MIGYLHECRQLLGIGWSLLTSMPNGATHADLFFQRYALQNELLLVEWIAIAVLLANP